MKGGKEHSASIEVVGVDGERSPHGPHAEGGGTSPLRSSGKHPNILSRSPWFVCRDPRHPAYKGSKPTSEGGLRWRGGLGL